MRKQMIEGQACFFKIKGDMKAEVVRPVAWTVKYNIFVHKIRAMIANQREVNATKPSSQRYREWPGYGVDGMRLNAVECVSRRDAHRSLTFKEWRSWADRQAGRRSRGSTPHFFELRLQSIVVSIVYRLKKVRFCFMDKFAKIVISCLCSVAGPASQISRAGNRCSRHQSWPWTYRSIQMLCWEWNWVKLELVYKVAMKTKLLRWRRLWSKPGRSSDFQTLASSQSTFPRMAGQRKAIHRAWRGKKETRARGGTIRQFDNSTICSFRQLWFSFEWLGFFEAQRNMERLNEERKRRFLMLEEKVRLMLSKHFLDESWWKDKRGNAKC